jgi:hypothetical protein
MVGSVFEFENERYDANYKNVLYFTTNGSITLSIYIELWYGALQSTRALCALCSIINFKSEMIDPNRSI